MGTFNFYLDTKVTTWMRTPFEIEAKNLEEAKKKAIEFHRQGNTDDIPWEENPDFQETISIVENNGQPTEEIFDEEGNVIWGNVSE
jgi:hypothetical protein